MGTCFDIRCPVYSTKWLSGKAWRLFKQTFDLLEYSEEIFIDKVWYEKTSFYDDSRYDDVVHVFLFDLFEDKRKRCVYTNHHFRNDYLSFPDETHCGSGH